MPSLIALQLDVLFLLGAGGGLVATRGPARRPAPRVFLGRSAEGNVWAIREDVDPITRNELARLLSDEPARLPRDFADVPRCRERVRALLAPIEAEHRGPAYVLPDVLPLDDRARELTDRESPKCVGAFPWLAQEREAVAPVAIAFEAGEPAAICRSPRGLTAAAAEAGIETLERFRGRGLATAAVACWARAVQRGGRLALYSTSWDNEASRAVARRLAARAYGEDWGVT